MHVHMGASVRICKIAAECKYIFSSLDQRRFFTFIMLRTRTKLLLTMMRRQSAFRRFETLRTFFSKVPKNLVNQENTCKVSNFKQ